MNRCVTAVVASFAAGGLGAVAVHAMGYEGRYVLWLLCLLFPFTVYCVAPQSGLLLLVLPSVTMGLTLAFILAVVGRGAAFEMFAGFVGLPATCFLLSWIGAIPLRLRKRT